MSPQPSAPDTIRHRLPDGRHVAVHQLARGDGPTIVHLHIAPGSGNLDPDPEISRARDITLLGIDRPGYGGSDPVADDTWASVAGAADDAAAVLDAAGTQRAGIVGWSAGGRVALALAARRPDLVDRVVVLGTPAPNDAVPWIPPELQAGLDALAGQPPAVVRAALEEQLAAIAPADPRAPEPLGLIGGGPADEAILAGPGVRERLTAMLATAFEPGPTIGMAADIAGYTLQPWGFEPSEVRAKTLLLYGARDETAGPRHGRWWQRALPDARLEVVPDAGHLLILPMWGRVLSFLAPRSGGRPTP